MRMFSGTWVQDRSHLKPNFTIKKTHNKSLKNFEELNHDSNGNLKKLCQSSSPSLDFPCQF